MVYNLNFARVYKKTKKGVYISSKIIALFPVISEVHSRQDNCVGVVVCSKLLEVRYGTYLLLK